MTEQYLESAKKLLVLARLSENEDSVTLTAEAAVTLLRLKEMAARLSTAMETDMSLARAIVKELSESPDIQIQAGSASSDFDKHIVEALFAIRKARRALGSAGGAPT